MTSDAFALVRLKDAQEHDKCLAYARDKDKELTSALWKCDRRTRTWYYFDAVRTRFVFQGSEISYVIYSLIVDGAANASVTYRAIWNDERKM